MSSIAEVRKGATVRLVAAGIATPQLDADILIGNVLNKGRLALLSDTDKTVSDADKITIEQLISLRSERVPVAYLIQRKEFWGLDFFVDSRVLIPRPETELVVEQALAFVARHAKPSYKILDVCTGSGAIIIALAHALKHTPTTFEAVDISTDALTVARINAQTHDVDSRITFQQSDLFTAFSGGVFDIIVSNPPYLTLEEMNALQPEVSKEPAIALNGGEKGLELPYRLISAAVHYLGPDGLLLVEHGAEQGSELRAFAGKYFAEVKTILDLQGFDRVLYCRSLRS